MRQKRYPLLLDATYPPERQLLEAIKAVPEGERGSFLRALILLGHQEIQQELPHPLTTQRLSEDGTGTH